MKSWSLILFRMAGFCGISQPIASRMLRTTTQAFLALNEKMRTLDEEARILSERFETRSKEARKFPEELPRLHARLETFARNLRTRHQEMRTAHKRVRFTIRFLETTLTASQRNEVGCARLESALARNEEVHRDLHEWSRQVEMKIAKYNSLCATAAIRQSARAKATLNWPRLWELLSFLLPKNTRERVFEPCRNELLEDFQRAKKYRGKWESRWLCTCFTLRTVLLVLDCWRAMIADKALSFFFKGVPESIKRWWLR
jgi:hypothetical protein